MVPTQPRDDSPANPSAPKRAQFKWAVIQEEQSSLGTSITLQILFEKKRSGRSGQETTCRQRTLTRRTLPWGIGSHTEDTDSWHVESLASGARDGLPAQESDRARPPSSRFSDDAALAWNWSYWGLTAWKLANVANLGILLACLSWLLLWKLIWLIYLRITVDVCSAWYWYGLSHVCVCLCVCIHTHAFIDYSLSPKLLNEIGVHYD